MIMKLLGHVIFFLADRVLSKFDDHGCGVWLSSITIDADGSPSGHIAWYNHSTGKPGFKVIKPTAKNERYGIQRIEMLAIYFAILRNRRLIETLANRQKKKQVIVNIRSDSRTCIEQLQGVSKIRDLVLRRICLSIKKLLNKMHYIIIFSHLERARNQAGLLLDQKRRKEIEMSLMHQYEKRYYSFARLVMDHYNLATA